MNDESKTKAQLLQEVTALRRQVAELKALEVKQQRQQVDLRLAHLANDRNTDSVFWIGPQAQILFANRGACRRLGYRRDELQALTVPDIDPHFTMDIWPDHWRDLKQNGSMVIETEHQTKEGACFPVEVRINYLEFDGREYNIAFARDITARKQEEARHIEQARQATAEAKRLTLLNEMAKHMDLAETEAEVYKVAAFYTPRIAPSEQISMTLLTEADDRVEVIRFTDEGEGDLPQEIQPLSIDTAVGHTIREGRLLNMPDIRDTDRPDLRLAAEQGLRSMLQVPLFVSGQVIGVLVLSSRRREAYTIRDEEIVCQIVAHLAAHIEARRLYRQTSEALTKAEDLAHRLALLNEMSHRLNLADSEKEVFNLAARYTYRTFPQAGRASVVLLNAEGGSFDVFALQEGRISNTPDGVHVPLAGRMIERVVKQKRVVNTSDIRSSEWLDYQSLVEDGLRSVIHAPLVTGGRVIGALNVGSKQLNAFGGSDKDLIRRVTALLASHIEGQRLFARVQAALAEATEQARRLVLLNEMGQQMNLVSREAEIFTLAMPYMSQIIPADRASIALLTASGDEFEVFALHGEAGTMPAGEMLPVRNSAAGQAVLEKRLINTPDLRAKQALDSQKLVQHNLRSTVNAPIMVGERVIGTLNVGSEETNAYSERDENLLLHVASFLGTTIFNARLLAEAEAARAAAEEASRAKSLFLANMSHELRTPLNAIIGFTRIVKRRSRETLPQKQLENLEKVMVSGEHLLNLINTVLDITKIEAGRLDVRPQTFKTDEVVRACLTTIQPLVKEPVRLEKEVAPDLPTIFSDRGKIKQILLNLLSNAAKFTSEGSITVTADQRQEDLVIEVADTGVGIKEEALSHIFEEFHQADSSSTRQYGGTGLGLSISRRLARLLGGDLTATSAAGVGSTFTLSVPRHYTEKPPETPSPSSIPKKKPPEAEKAVVLAIDDDPDVIYMLQEELGEAGYQVLGALSGEEGLRKARELQPFAITLDVMMPQKNGWQILQELKTDAATRSIPVILLTIVDEKTMGYRLGATDYLLKPLDERAVLTALERLAAANSGHFPTRLLVIDDDPQVSDLVRQLLRGKNCQVDMIADGREALAAVARQRPDLILLDLMMPRVDGFDVIAQLRQDPAAGDIPIFVLTAKMLTSEEMARLQDNAIKVIQKQRLDGDRLIREIRRASGLIGSNFEGRNSKEEIRRKEKETDNEEDFSR